MGLMRKLRGELVDIIEWVDDSRTTLAWRFPRYNNEIKHGAELIVREGQRAIFVYRGRLADEFGPGHYQLNTESLPLLSSIEGWKHGFTSPFRSEVYFINTRPVTDLRWGTPQPVTIRDPDFKMVQIRAHGLCVVKVDDPTIFLREVIGTDSAVDVNEITELLRQVIAVAFTDLISSSGLGAIELQTRQLELSGELRNFVVERVDDEFGLSIPELTMQVSLPNEITEAMTRGVARGVEESGYVHNIGDLDRYRQVKSADAVLAAASNEGGGAMGDMMSAGMGMALAGQMANTIGSPVSNGAPASNGAPTPPPLPQQASYFVAINGQQAGPFTAAQIQPLISSGQVTSESLVWSEGMAGWAAASSVPAVQALFGATPPPLPPSE